MTETYNHNYGNCILTCTHRKKFNRNVYIPGIIRAGLCYTLPLIIPSGLPASDPSATVYTSREKAYNDDPSFRKRCDSKAMSLIYEHQQQEHIRLMQTLETVPKQFHKLPFHCWIHHNTPVNALTEKAHEMLWHQRLVHLSPSTIQEAHKFVDGVPNLSKFSFDDIDQCKTCLRANLRKRSAGKRSLSESVSCPYQGLFIDFGFSGRLSYNKDSKVIESSRTDIEGINGETAWI